MTQDELERKLYVVRKRAEAEIAAADIHEKEFFYVPSLSSRTIVYKGLLLAPQIAEFYSELLDPGLRRARSAWCTSASPPTPFPPGSWRIRSATSATTARSTRCGAT